LPDRTPIQLPPGIFRRGSEAEVGKGRWYEGNLVRWVSGVLRPVGGWEKQSVGPFSGGLIRKIHQWTDSTTSIVYTAVFCETKLFVYDQGGTLQDITPDPAISPPTHMAAGGYGDNIYYGSGGGYTPPDTGIPPVYPDPEGYGLERPDKADSVALGEMWSLDNWGDDLVAMASSDGRLLRWKPSDPAGTLATVVPGAPSGRFFIVTPERHLMVFWDGDIFNKFGWCSQEDIEDWTYTDTTTSAGFYEMEPAAPFIAAVVTRSAIVAFTATSAYAITYVGTPYFYAYNYLGHYNAPVSGNAVTQVSTGAIWLATDGFWLFDGATVSSLPCDLLDEIQQTIDPLWRYRRTHAVYLGSESEVWFFYPTLGSTENTRYVTYNFDEKWWSQGKMGRTCGFPGSALSYPMMSDGTSIFAHEKGFNYSGIPELPYAQTGAINIAAGARQCTARQGIVDTRAPANDVTFMVAARKDRIANGTLTPDVRLGLAVRRDGGKLDFRVTGRDLVVRIQSARNGVPPWSFGQMLVKLFPRGGR